MLAKYCSTCGNEVNELAEICVKCGVRISSPPTPVRIKSKITAAILAFLLGAIGGHKFYLGRFGWGILYLIFCWTFLPALAGIIEGIIYLTMSDEAFSAKYEPSET